MKKTSPSTQTVVGSGLALGLFLSVPFPTLIVAALHERHWAWPQVLPMVVLFYASWRLAILQFQGKPRLVTLCYWIFVYVFLGLVPFVQLLRGEGLPWHGQTYSTDTIVQAYLAILLGLAAFDFGQRLATSSRLGSSSSLTRCICARNLSRRRMQLFALIAIVTSIVMVVEVGGFDTLFVARLERAKAIQGLAGGEGQTMLEIWSALLRTPSVAASFCMLAFYSSRRSLGYIGIALFTASSLLVLLISNPISTARFWVGTILFGSVFMIMRWNSRRSVTLFSVAMVCILVVLFPAADAFRSSMDADLEGRFTAASISDILAMKPDFDAFQQTLNAVDYVKAEGYTHGMQLYGTLLFWVPRSTWADKPEATGALVAAQQGYKFKNLSLPLWAEVYVDGGYVLILATFLAYGVFVGQIEGQFLKDRALDRATFSVVFVPIFAPYQFYLLRGSLMPALAGLAPLVLCLLLNTRQAPTREIARETQQVV